MEASAHEADAAATRALDAALARLEESVGDAEFVAELIGDFPDGLPAQLEAEAARATPALASARDQRLA